jgi:valyl-tRNA synthetase
VEDGKVKFVPETWSKTCLQWMHNIRDWCISRQLWWGHRIPAWYCQACHGITVARETPAACVECAGTSLKQDEDVLDTWFSSWLWPFATLGWPAESRALRTFYPTSLMVTGYDILFFWVARMLMAGLHFMGKVPFRTVYLHTIVTDEKGEKMSKVLGNTIDPVDAITKCGADSLRFSLAWLTTFAAQGKNIKFATSNTEDAQRFCNKIWNATRFAALHLDEYDPTRFADRTAEGPESLAFDLPERWILSRAQHTAEATTLALEEYRIADATRLIYHFIWHDLCDWYIELAKKRLQSQQDPDEQDSDKWKVQGALVMALETAMRLLHPFMPFITEELWQRLPKAPGAPQSIMITLYPVPNASFIDDAAETSMALLQKVITTVRALRTAHNIPSSVRTPVILSINDDTKKTILESYGGLIAEQARCDQVIVRTGGDPPAGPVATGVAGDVEVILHLPAVADTGQERAKLERAKLEKDRSRLVTDRDFVTRKLNNPEFLARAPAAVLSKDRNRLAEIDAALGHVEAALARLP